MTNRSKVLILALGDIFLLYGALFLTLGIRYSQIPGEPAKQFSENHLEPFTVIFTVWIFIFYVVGLYDTRNLKNKIEFLKNFSLALGIGTVIAIAFFYLIPFFGITPKTNLFIFLLVFGATGLVWRWFFNYLLSKGAPLNKLLVIGANPDIEKLVSVIEKNPQLGYEVKFWMKEGLEDKELNHLAQIILSQGIPMIVVPAHIKKDLSAAKLIYKNLVLGIEVVDLATIYENVFRKIPLNELEEVWFLENLTKKHKLYEIIKRPLEMLAALILLVTSLPFMALVALLIKLTSPGSVILKQQRIGQRESEFTAYKFRTMRPDAEKDGPQFAKPKDSRVTAIGRFLRHTHLDELPQLVNILKGEMSFVGPRPERPEFVKELKEKINYYEIRHLLKPGITGWAQINYRPNQTLVEDTLEKLQYDIYYLKNRSFILDFVIILKTLRYFFSNIR